MATNRWVVRSRQLETVLRDFAEEVSLALAAETAAGAEVPFELVAQSARGRGPALYCYRPLTGQFIREREARLGRLPSYPAAARALQGVAGLDRYLAACGLTRLPKSPRERANVALRGLLGDVFGEATDFMLRPERLDDALMRLHDAAFGAHDQITMLVAAISGLATSSTEVSLADGLALVHGDALAGAPEEAVVGEDGRPQLLAVVSVHSDGDGGDKQALECARERLRDLIRALRLFGDGRVTLGLLGWSRSGGGAWRPVALGGGGRPRGMLVVTAEQEHELRAFCGLVVRRAPRGDELVWALSRYELGCERASDFQALSDYLLALRSLLEPEGPSSGLLPGRLAALCAEPDRRAALAERAAHAMALERAVIAGSAVEQAGGDALVQAIGDHLRALLRDVICGHLDPDLVGLADELLAPADDGAGAYDEGLPADDEGLPADDEGLPADDEGLPADDEGLPADDEGLPADDEGLPADDEGLPADDEEPTSERRAVAGDDQSAEDEYGWGDDGDDFEEYEDEPSVGAVEAWRGVAPVSAFELADGSAGGASAVRASVGDPSAVRASVGDPSAVRASVGDSSAVRASAGDSSAVRASVGDSSAVRASAGADTAEIARVADGDSEQPADPTGRWDARRLPRHPPAWVEAQRSQGTLPL